MVKLGAALAADLSVRRANRGWAGACTVPDATFLEVVLQAADFTFGGRDEVEDPLDEALQAAGIGEVTGGGTGLGIANIDVEVTDLTAGLAIIRQVLRGLGVPRSTVVVQYQPHEVRHPLFEDDVPGPV